MKRISSLLIAALLTTSAYAVKSMSELITDGLVAEIKARIEADPQCVNEMTDGFTPLHCVAAQRDNSLAVSIAQMLMDYGATVEMLSKYEATPLHHATKKNHLNMVVFLIERGADVNAQDEDGDTPLHLASDDGSLEIARYLLNKGARVDATNKKGEMPLHLAAHLEIAELLIEKGAEISQPSNEGNTPLHLALKRSYDTAVAQLLIDRGAPLNTKNAEGDTPLHLAARPRYISQRHLKIITDLLTLCPETINAPSKDGETPLDIATRTNSGNLRILQVIHNIFEAHGAVRNRIYESERSGTCMIQ